MFLAPAILLYSVLTIYPLVTGLSYSFFSWHGTARDAFIGLGNYKALFTTYPLNEQLPRAVLNTCLYFIGAMLVQNTVGLLLAALLHHTRRGRQFFRTLYLMPYLISPIVVAYLWAMILSPSFGPLAAFLQWANLDALNHPWLGDTSTALPTLVLISAWQWLGFPMLLFGTAMAGIPEEYYQAAQLDGASEFAAFWHITRPLLVPVMGIVTVLTFIGNFGTGAFGLVFGLEGSNGGPAGSTDNLALVFYRTAFMGGGNGIGIASALSVLMFVLIVGVAMGINRLSRAAEERLS
jgi:raffinose/stachyose/melibiose transport system permease protein